MDQVRRIFKETPGTLSVRFHRWRAGDDDTTSNYSVSPHKHNTPYIIVAPVPRSQKEEEKEIRQQLKEFVKAYEQKFGNPSKTIIPKPKKSRLSYNTQKTLNINEENDEPRGIEEIEEERQKVIAIEERDRVRQQQIDFIKEYEQKAEEAELVNFENQQQKERIRQQQLDFIREFERKLKEEEEHKAAEARKYEESVWQQQVNFIREFEEKEERERIIRLKKKTKIIKNTGKRAKRDKKAKVRAARENTAKYRLKMAKKNRRKEKLAKKQMERERKENMKVTKKASRTKSKASFTGETSYGYDIARAEDILRQRQAKQRRNMTEWFYRCCCRVYCCTTVVLVMAAIVIVVI